ncbi:MAG: PaaI family thioesterase [Bacteroidales bacterium]|nr:PaaI family thioesterase [Bacteroidales bacterium]
MELTAIAREVFLQDRYATEATGIHIAYAGDHESECTLELDDRHCNARGAAMGGVLYTLADFASAVAANSDDLEEGTLHWVSLDASIHYLAPAVGRKLVAGCKPLKTGRTTSLYQTTIQNPDNGKVVAIVETTMVRV